ncbi:unnamed protein product [Amoebophrya sp. A120]|nr:unnamed protein product [Amoebophrya sp. A120]|eukprot:GSA120T00001272001.1
MPVKKHPPTVFYWSKIRSKWMEAKLEMTALDTNDNVLYHDLDIKPRAIKREPVRFRLHQPLHETASGALIGIILCKVICDVFLEQLFPDACCKHDEIQIKQK